MMEKKALLRSPSHQPDHLNSPQLRIHPHAMHRLSWKQPNPLSTMLIEWSPTSETISIAKKQRSLNSNGYLRQLKMKLNNSATKDPDQNERARNHNYDVQSQIFSAAVKHVRKLVFMMIHSSLELSGKTKTDQQAEHMLLLTMSQMLRL